MESSYNVQVGSHSGGLPGILPGNVSGVATWPEAVMTGAAGQFARTYGNYLESPEAFLFMGYLTILGHIISNKVTLQSEIAPQPRLYTVLLGESADTRKTTAINKAFDPFRDAVPQEINEVGGVGSAEGLAKALAKYKRVIVTLDELQALVQKCMIDGSVLLTCINTLFEKDFYQNETSRQSLLVEDGHLSILAASTLETYETMFRSQFLNIGFTNRFFLVIGNSRRKFAIPKCIPEMERRPVVNQLREVLGFVGDLSRHGCYALPIDPEAAAIFEQWYHTAQGSVFGKRLDTFGHRLMVLLAVNDMQDRITPAVAAQTVTLLRYQLDARRYADPIQADTQVARTEEKIRRLVKDGPIKKRDLERRGHKTTKGIYAWDCAIKNLTNAQELYFDSKVKTYYPGPEL